MPTAQQPTSPPLTAAGAEMIDPPRGPHKRWTRGDTWLVVNVLAMLVAGLMIASAQAHELPDGEEPSDTAWLDDAAWAELASLNGEWSRDVAVEQADGKLVLRSKGLPDHATGRFPNASNPNAIRPQSYRFSLPFDPVTHDTSRGRAPG